MIGHDGIRIAEPDIAAQGEVPALGPDYGAQLQQALYDTFATEDVPFHKYAVLQELAEAITRERKALAADVYYLLQNCQDCSRCKYGEVRHRSIYDVWVCSCPAQPDCRPVWRGADSGARATI